MRTDDNDANGRPLRDAGRLALIVMAAPLAAYSNSGRGVGDRETVPHYSAAGERRNAAQRPATALDAAAASASRFLAWLGIFLVSLPAFIVASFLRKGLGPASDVVLIPVMTGTAFTGMFGSVSVLIALARLTVVRAIGWRGFPAETWKLGKNQWHQRERRRRAWLARRGGPSRIVRWLCTPSHLDGVFALIWALAFTQVIMEGVHR